MRNDVGGGHVPERILRATVDTSAEDWTDWRIESPPQELLCAEEPREGECLPDTSVIADTDGQLYLFCSCREAGAIAGASLHPAS